MSGQNTSTAVMQRRKAGTAAALDDYPTPPWAVRAFVEHVLRPALYPLRPEDMTCWEPCCNRGYMATSLAEAFYKMQASDVHDYGWPGMQARHDFLLPFAPDGFSAGVDMVITNPPFRLAEQCIRRGLDVARVGVAVLVRTAFLEGKARYDSLFREMPPAVVAQYVERVPMVEGRYDPDAASATAYCWLLWIKAGQRELGATRLTWIPPCRSEFERDSDRPQRRASGGMPLFGGVA